MQNKQLVPLLVSYVAARPDAGYNYAPSHGTSGGTSGGDFNFSPSGGSNGLFVGTSGGNDGFVGISGGGSSSGISSISGGFDSFNSPGVQTSTVTKHVYVHVPPPDYEVPRTPIVIGGGGQSQKHYKIIFIKAPSYNPAPAPIIPLQSQNEEKTLVYVLVKKPEEAGDVIIPTPAPTQPSKPEVYFIRYKTQKGHGSTSVSTQTHGAPSTSPVSNYGPPPSSRYGAPSR